MKWNEQMNEKRKFLDSWFGYVNLLIWYQME